MSDTGPRLPAAIRAHLGAPSLVPLWSMLRTRLERTGHALRGSVVVVLEEDGADRLSGLLGRAVSAGDVRVSIVAVDTALRQSAAGRGIASVVAELTGAPLRDRPAERSESSGQWSAVWTAFDAELVASGLSTQPWVAGWVAGLRRAGVLTRLGASSAQVVVARSVSVVAALAGTLGATSDDAARPRPASRAELATTHLGDAHALDDDRPEALLVLRAAAAALALSVPASAAERRALWAELGVTTDVVSGTVMTWGLRPPGRDSWSRMMHDRAEQGLVTHLTAGELKRLNVRLAEALVHACENPQVLQAAAVSGVPQPLVCFSGNPSTAGALLLQHLPVAYHGDFDWPGIAIAGRMYAGGAVPWRMSATDYGDALQQVAPTHRLGLAGRPQPTPWDVALAPAMAHADTAVHEESVIETLLTDLW